jgi:hypothetical protein
MGTVIPRITVESHFGKWIKKNKVRPIQNMEERTNTATLQGSAITPKAGERLSTE